MPLPVRSKWEAVVCLCLVFSMAACQAISPSSSPTLLPTSPIPLSPTQAPTASVLPPPEATPTAALSPEPSPISYPHLCSPLQGIAWADIPATISNPFHPPQPGSDYPHQGVDFADTGEGGIALTGRVVQAVMDGQVAAVIVNRFPYGNALLVESPVERIPASWLEALNLPAPVPTLEAIPALTCPSGEPVEYDPQKRSIYLLYAHMEALPTLEPGQKVLCGQAIGTVGMSGNALNPHLHLEMRVAPAGIRLESMAHYDNSATAQEMANYCLWRVNGLFQLVDPMQLWSLENP